MLRTIAVTLLLALVLLAALSMMESLTTSHATTSLTFSVAPVPTLVISRGGVASLSSSSSILGRPSLSVAFVNRVLSAYSSPAAGLGSVLYADSLTYGIDDLYALGFFWHESSMGKAGMARSTHSLGNIRCTPGWSCIGGYRSYATWAAGFDDWFRLISTEYLPRGLSTIASIIPVYAPSADHNDEHAYIAAVLSAVSAWRSGRVLV